MGVLSTFLGGGGGGGDAFSVFRGPSNLTGLVPKAPPIPDVIEPSDPRVQAARRATSQRSTFLARTRGGTLLARATPLEGASTTSTSLLGG